MKLQSMYKLLEDVNDLFPLFESSQEYRKLVKVFHPDKGGDPEIFKAITKVEQASDMKTLQYLVDNINDKDKIIKYLQLNGYLESKRGTELSTEVKSPEENKEADAEVIDEPDNQEQEDNSDAEIIEDEREGASEEYQKALENQYALIQIYKEAILIILYKKSEQELSKQERKEILMLLDEWEEQVDKYYNEDILKLKIQSEMEGYIKLVNSIRLDIIDLRTKIKNVKSVYKIDIFKIIDKTWEGFKNIINAKLPKGLIQTIMYSNPLTAIIADNFDIVSNIAGSTYNTVKSMTQKNKTEKNKTEKNKTEKKSLN